MFAPAGAGRRVTAWPRPAPFVVGREDFALPDRTVSRKAASVMPGPCPSSEFFFRSRAPHRVCVCLCVCVCVCVCVCLC